MLVVLRTRLSYFSMWSWAPDVEAGGRLGGLSESPFISTLTLALTKPLMPALVSAGSVRGAHFW